jgi:hypothetical protein
MYETRIKQFLYNFIHKDLIADVDGASEIVQGLSFEALVHIVQLCILESSLQEGYIDPTQDNGNLRNLRKYMANIMKIPPDTVIWGEHTYYGRKYGYNQPTTLKIGESVKETLQQTIDSVAANAMTEGLKEDGFDLLKDVASVHNDDQAKFVQYVFNTDGNDGRINHVNNPSSNVSEMVYSIYEGAPDNAFSVGDLAFVWYKRETADANSTGTFFPCEIVGYLNGQYAVRWIDSRRQYKKEKWITFDAPNKNLLHLGDFLKETLVHNEDTDFWSNDDLDDSDDEAESVEAKKKRIASRAARKKEMVDGTILYPLEKQLRHTRKISQNKYRDYIQKINGDAMPSNLQPTNEQVPNTYRTVAIEYKNSDQLRSWDAMYPNKRAPSERWKTSYANKVNKPLTFASLFSEIKWQQDDKFV